MKEVEKIWNERKKEKITDREIEREWRKSGWKPTNREIICNKVHCQETQICSCKCCFMKKKIEDKRKPEIRKLK